MMSSEYPRANMSSRAPSLRLVKGSTAMEGRSVTPVAAGSAACRRGVAQRGVTTVKPLK